MSTAPWLLPSVASIVQCSLELSNQSTTRKIQSCGELAPGFALSEVYDRPKVSKARKLTAWGYQTDAPIELYRLSDGSFDSNGISAAISFGDSLVVSQTVLEYLAQEEETHDDTVVAKSINMDNAYIKDTASESDGDTTTSSSAASLLVFPTVTFIVALLYLQ